MLDSLPDDIREKMTGNLADRNWVLLKKLLP